MVRRDGEENLINNQAQQKLRQEIVNSYLFGIEEMKGWRQTGRPATRRGIAGPPLTHCWEREEVEPAISSCKSRTKYAQLSDEGATTGANIGTEIESPISLPWYYSTRNKPG